MKLTNDTQHKGKEMGVKAAAPFPSMNILRSRRLQSQVVGFTLIEIMLAMAILSVIAIAIYQFTATTLQSAQFYVRISDQETAYAGLRGLLTTQLSGLPTGMPGTLTGLQIRGKNGPRDALQLVCSPGNGTLTPSASGYYEMTLDVREYPRGSGKYALGMERTPHDDDDDDDDAVPTQAANRTGKRDVRKSDWIKLIDGVNNLEIAYFDSRLNGWVDKWNDPAILPNLVRLRLIAAVGQPPYELVARVPAGGIRREALTYRAGAVAPPINGQNNGNLAPAQPSQISTRITR